MALGGDGYWHNDYWHNGYWHTDYWTEGGTPPPAETAQILKGPLGSKILPLIGGFYVWLVYQGW
jgi:hypothetical protein